MLDPVQHPIFEALNKPLLILGVDRRIFGLALFAGLMCYWRVHGGRGLLIGVVAGAILWLAGRVGAAKDPEFVSLLIVSAKLRKNYDAGKR